jgi:hypothetical protein
MKGSNAVARYKFIDVRPNRMNDTGYIVALVGALRYIMGSRGFPVFGIAISSDDFYKDIVGTG